MFNTLRHVDSGIYALQKPKDLSYGLRDLIYIVIKGLISYHKLNPIEKFNTFNPAESEILFGFIGLVLLNR